MQNNFYLDGDIYHMVLFSNLASILRRRALLSKDMVLAEGISYHSIANEEVQGLRERVYIWHMSLKQWRSLHSYVPFYFAKRTPMLYIQFQAGLQEEIVFLEVRRSIVDDPGVVFTGGNATIQLLSKFGIEQVKIIPATATKPTCRRRYSSGNPQGTNTNCSDVYSGSALLRNLDWQGIADNYWGRDDEKKRIKHAEVLIPDLVPLAKIAGISTLTPGKAKEVNWLIQQYHLKGRLPDAISNPDLYF